MVWFTEEAHVSSLSGSGVGALLEATSCGWAGHDLAPWYRGEAGAPKGRAGKATARLEQLRAFVDRVGRLPQRSGADGEERALGQWYHNAKGGRVKLLEADRVLLEELVATGQARRLQVTYCQATVADLYTTGGEK